MIRILSDTHWGHKASLIKDFDSLKELAEEARTVVFNGDTIEQKFEDSPSHKHRPLPSLADLKRTSDRWSSDCIFLTGNHDPKISDAHFCEFNGGDILITHGDAVYDSVAPWSRHNAVLRNAVAEGIDRLPSADRSTFHQYLQVFKDASLAEHAMFRDYDPTVWGKIRIFIRQAWPPTRVFTILKCWKDAPERAEALARRFGKKPKFMILGHTHKPDIATVNETTVINTGSFFPWPGATAVDVETNGITVRKIRKRGARFATTDIVGRFNLDIDLSSLKVIAEPLLSLNTLADSVRPAKAFGALRKSARPQFVYGQGDSSIRA